MKPTLRLLDPADMTAAELRAELMACGFDLDALDRLKNWPTLAATVSELRALTGAATLTAPTMPLSEPELAAIDRNHTRLAAIDDGGQTLDMFATGPATEDLTLCGETIRPATTRTAPAPDAQLSLL